MATRVTTFKEFLAWAAVTALMLPLMPRQALGHRAAEGGRVLARQPGTRPRHRSTLERQKTR